MLLLEPLLHSLELGYNISNLKLHMACLKDGWNNILVNWQPSDKSPADLDLWYLPAHG